MDCCEKPTSTPPEVVCPKPRRLRPWEYNINNPIPSLRFHVCNDADSRARAESPGLFLRKIDFKAEGAALSSTTPFLVGSPPGRITNPLVRDEYFSSGKVASICKSSSESALSRMGHLREQLGNQAPVRVDGFDCPRSSIFAIS